MEPSVDKVTPLSSSYEFLRFVDSPSEGTRCGCILQGPSHGTDNFQHEEQSDYELLVTGGTGGEVIIWKLMNDGTVGTINAFICHQGTIMDVIGCSLAPCKVDENSSSSELVDNGGFEEASWMFYTCGRDNMIFRCNVSGSKLVTFEGHDNVVCNLYEFNNGKRLASGSWDGTAIIWDTTLGTMEYRLKGDAYKHSVYCNSLSDGTVLTGMTNGDVCFWKEGKLDNVVRAHDGVVRAISIKDGNIITCANDCSVRIYSENMALILNIPMAHENFIYDVRHSRKFPVFFTSSEDKSVSVWHLDTGELLQTISADSSVWKMVESRFNIIVLIPLNGSISIWQLNPAIPRISNARRMIGGTTASYEKTANTSEFNGSFEMTKFSKVNATKAMEYFTIYNETKLPETALTAKDISTIKNILISTKVPQVDLSFISKILQWPLAERIPVFDLLKVLLLDPESSTLFKGRNSGYQIYRTLSTTVKEAGENAPLVTVSLQVLANMCILTLPRTIIINHFDSVIETIKQGGKICTKMAQQAHSVCVENLIIASLDNMYDRAEKIMDTIMMALSVLRTVKEPTSWLGGIMLRHCRSLETMLCLEKRVASLVTKSCLLEIMLDMTETLPTAERKNVEGAIHKLQRLVN